MVLMTGLRQQTFVRPRDPESRAVESTAQPLASLPVEGQVDPSVGHDDVGLDASVFGQQMEQVSAVQ
jgi:hypothetical protein